MRYIDDFVLCFQYRADTLRVQKALCQRLRKFGLTLEPTKTKLVEVGHFAQRHASKRGRNRPQTIYFLGFTLYCTRNRKGNFRVELRTEKSRLRRSLMRQDQMRRVWHLSIREQAGVLNQMLRGPLCVLRHCREHPRIATGPSGRRALLEHHAQQSELEGSGLVEAIPVDQGAVSIGATKAVSPLVGVASYRLAVKHLPTSVVREICTLRSVGAGARATAFGHPVGSQQRLSLPRSTVDYLAWRLFFDHRPSGVTLVTDKSRSYAQH